MYKHASVSIARVCELLESNVHGIGRGARLAARGAAHMYRLVSVQLRQVVQRDDDGSSSP